MSYITVYRIEPNGDVTPVENIAYASSFHALVWKVLGWKYGLVTPTRYIESPGVVDSILAMGGKGTLPPDEDLLLQSTRQRTCVPLEHIRWICDLLESFYERHGKGKGEAATMPRIAKAIRAALQEQPECLGVTIEIGNTHPPVDWVVCDEETGEKRPYNVHVDDNHEWVEQKGCI